MKKNKWTAFILAAVMLAQGAYIPAFTFDTGGEEEGAVITEYIPKTSVEHKDRLRYEMDSIFTTHDIRGFKERSSAERLGLVGYGLSRAGRFLKYRKILNPLDYIDEQILYGAGSQAAESAASAAGKAKISKWAREIFGDIFYMGAFFLLGYYVDSYLFEDPEILSIAENPYLFIEADDEVLNTIDQNYPVLADAIAVISAAAHELYLMPEEERAAELERALEQRERESMEVNIWELKEDSEIYKKYSRRFQGR